MNKEEISRLFNDLLAGLDFFSEFTPADLRKFAKRLSIIADRKVELDKDNAIQTQVDQVLALGGGFKNFSFTYEGETIIVENGDWRIDKKNQKNQNELIVGEIYLIPDDKGELLPIKYNGGRQNKLFMRFAKNGGNFEEARLKQEDNSAPTQEELLTHAKEVTELEEKVDEIRRENRKRKERKDADPKK